MLVSACERVAVACALAACVRGRARWAAGVGAGRSRAQRAVARRRRRAGAARRGSGCGRRAGWRNRRAVRGDSAHERFAGHAAVAVDAAWLLSFGAWLDAARSAPARRARKRRRIFWSNRAVHAAVVSPGRPRLGLEARAGFRGRTRISARRSRVAERGRPAAAERASFGPGVGGLRRGIGSIAPPSAAGDPQRLRLGDRSALA